MSTALQPSQDTTLGAADGSSEVWRSARPRPYTRLHDDLRRQLLRLMLQALDVDASDPARRNTFASATEHALRRCEAHLALEESQLHGLLRARAPRALMAVELDHEQLQQSQQELRCTLDQLRGADNIDAAGASVRELQWRLSVFVADALAHMAEEESVLTRAWWAHFSDDEIRARLAAIDPPLAAPQP